MITNPIEIDLVLRTIIRSYVPYLQLRKDDSSGLEAAGTIPTMQGKQKVDGFYFASIIPKPKDCRLYFFPIYTDVERFKNISPALRSCLKGKSCFHIKKLDDDLTAAITEMVAQGIEIYQAQGRIEK